MRDQRIMQVAALLPLLGRLLLTGRVMTLQGVSSFVCNPSYPIVVRQMQQPRRSQSFSPLEMVTFPMLLDTEDETLNSVPEVGRDGVYHLSNAEQHRALLNEHKDKLIVLKIFAPYCKECKRVEPHMKKLQRKKEFSETSSIIWADFAMDRYNKDHAKALGIIGIPTTQFYVHGGLEDTFPCGISNVPELHKRLIQNMNKYIDNRTQRLKTQREEDAKAAAERLASVFEDRSPPEWLFR